MGILYHLALIAVGLIALVNAQFGYSPKSFCSIQQNKVYQRYDQIYEIYRKYLVEVSLAQSTCGIANLNTPSIVITPPRPTPRPTSQPTPRPTSLPTPRTTPQPIAVPIPFPPRLSRFCQSQFQWTALCLYARRTPNDYDEGVSQPPYSG
ncbi:endoglucanase A [Drosophila busckii]|uniref:endoglucanase A n=1 Tax=Drosophila busckii TaxID=30019 RepID=UPI001432ED4C|nr:endoglucanase A [Drosophila busckii]